jgi:hypothetical protein
MANEKGEFLSAVEAFEDAALNLTRKWEAVEMATGDTPSDVDGYPFKESFDELVHSIIEWRHNVKDWVVASESPEPGR